MEEVDKFETLSFGFVRITGGFGSLLLDVKEVIGVIVAAGRPVAIAVRGLHDSIAVPTKLDLAKLIYDAKVKYNGG